MRTLYLALLCLIVNTTLLANNTSFFSKNPKEFLDQVEKFILTAKPNASKELIQDLRNTINNNTISEKEFDLLVSTSNLFKSNKIKVDPYFLSYLKSVIELKKNNYSYTQFISWHKVTNEFLKKSNVKNSKSFRIFLKFSSHFFENGSLYFSKSGTSWTATAKDFQFSYSNQQPQIYFEKTHLVAQSQKGKIQITETSGTFLPLKNHWKGNGGKTLWKDRHPNLEEVYCEFGKYNVDLKKGSYAADSVQLFFPKILSNQPILGKLKDKITKQNKKQTSSFPQFQSYQNDLNINNMLENASFKGGLEIKGQELTCFGTQVIPASWIQYTSMGEKCFEIFSNKIKMETPKAVIAKQAAIKVFFDEHFIAHPSAQIKYSASKKTLSLTAETINQSSVPFYDSYHQVLIYSPILDVLLEKKEIIFNQKKFNIGNPNYQISFQSTDMWNPKEFARIKAFSKLSPIILIAVMAKREKKRIFTMDEIAEGFKLKGKSSIFTSLFIDLMHKGFIIYSPKKNEIEVLDKTLHYYEVKEKEKDFDQFILKSHFDKTNAVMDMENKEINIEGVNVLEFSHFRKVAVEPLEERLTLKRNRALDFSGKIYSGKTMLTGKSFHFDYDAFHIVMDSIEHIDIFKEEEMTAKGGETKFTSLGSRIEDVSGIIQIDDPNNKSGKEIEEVYPKFQSTSSSYVYYDAKEFQKGQFQRDSFFFELDQFSFSDMNKISAGELKFKGRLFSSEIFPTIEAVLEVQPDGQILGFQKKIESSVPLYSGKGKYQGAISLNKKGLTGNGKVSFQTATFESDSINFLPKKLTSFAHHFELKNRGGKYPLPMVQGDSAKINWSISKDSMLITPKGKPFKLFQNKGHEFVGQLVLTADSLAGSGTVSWDLGSLKSDEIRFSENGIQSNFADLEFKSKNETTLGINTKNVNANIQFDKNWGTFKSQKKEGTVEFPSNQYKTTLLDFDWNMGNQTVTFHLDDQPGEFTSTHTDKDSLYFNGKKGIFDLESGRLNIEGVKGILSADSWIQTKDGKVTIDNNGEMKNIKDAIIFAGKENQNHIFKNAEVIIFGKNEFSGKGNYEYMLEDQIQIIPNLIIEGSLSKKGKKEKLTTEIYGEILDTNKFFVKEKINFQGEVVMSSDNRNIKFEGFGKMCTIGKGKMHWFEMEHHTTKNDSTIAFHFPKNPNGKTLHTGIFINRETGTLYPRVMMPLLNNNDRSIFETTGVLKVIEDQNSFWLGDSTKVASPQNLGNVVHFPMDASSLVTIGKFKIDTFLNPIKLKLVGKANINFSDTVLNKSTSTSTDFKIRALAGLDLPLPKSLVNIILTDIQSTNFDTPSNIQKDRDFFLNILPEFLNKPQDLSKAFKNLTTNELLVLPEEKNKHTFLLSNLHLNWDEDSQSFLSTKKEIGLVSINGIPINNLLEGYFQLMLANNEEDRLYFYLKSPSGNFYYFGFKDGILETYSDFEMYNETVLDLKKKEREIKLRDGYLFEIMLANDNAASNFLNRIRYIQN